jgi:hypothetical protein
MRRILSAVAVAATMLGSITISSGGIVPGRHCHPKQGYVCPGVVR